MENQDLTPHHEDTSRPTIGFPLGTALLLIVIFCLSGFFSCCYHWDKLRSLRRSFSADTDLEAHTPHAPSKPTPTYPNSKQNQSQSLPVLMPGDQIPKFIALSSPRKPPQPENIVVRVQTPPPSPPRPIAVYNHVTGFDVYYNG